MIETFLVTLNQGLAANSWLAIIAAGAWGVASVLLSPCHLASIPLLIGYIASQESTFRKSVFILSLLFAFGILITIAVLGLITALLGGLLGDIGTGGNVLVALVLVLIGLYLMDVISLPWSGFQFSTDKHSGLLAALILGLLFGIGLGPCTFAFMAPVLGVVFRTATTNVTSAITLLSAFALGHCAIIVVAGVLAGRIGEYLNWSQRTRIAVYVKRVCGSLVILGGVYMIWKMF